MIARGYVDPFPSSWNQEYPHELRYSMILLAAYSQGAVLWSCTSHRMTGRREVFNNFAAPFNTPSSAPSTSSLIKSTLSKPDFARYSSIGKTSTRTGCESPPAAWRRKLLHQSFVPPLRKRSACVCEFPRAYGSTWTLEQPLRRTWRTSLRRSRGEGSNAKTLPFRPTRFEARSVYKP